MTEDIKITEELTEEAVPADIDDRELRTLVYQMGLTRLENK